MSTKDRSSKSANREQQAVNRVRASFGEVEKVETENEIRAPGAAQRLKGRGYWRTESLRNVWRYWAYTRTPANMGRVNQRTGELGKTDLAPQIELELGAFWLTALVVFSESAPQEQNFNHVLQDRCIIAELVVWRGRCRLALDPRHHYEVGQPVTGPTAQPSDLPIAETRTNGDGGSKAEELGFNLHGVDHSGGPHSHHSGGGPSQVGNWRSRQASTRRFWLIEHFTWLLVRTER